MRNKIYGLIVGGCLLVLLAGCSIERDESTFQLKRLDTSTSPVMQDVYYKNVGEQVYSTTEISPP